MKRIALAVAVVAAMALAPAALAAGTLSGKYKTKISGYRVNGVLNGTWVIDFTSGAYTVTDNGKTADYGKDTITGNQIAFHDKGGPDKCSGTGKYTFKLTGTTLKFTVISEASACKGRHAVLTHAKFTKV
jgi:hypothetical protein